MATNKNLKEILREHGGQAFMEVSLIFPRDPIKGMVINPSDDFKISQNLANMKTEQGETIEGSKKTAADYIKSATVRLTEDILKTTTMLGKFALEDRYDKQGQETGYCQSNVSASLGLTAENGKKYTLSAVVNSIGKEEIKLHATDSEKSAYGGLDAQKGKLVYVDLEFYSVGKDVNHKDKIRIQMVGAIDKYGKLIPRAEERETNQGKGQSSTFFQFAKIPDVVDIKLIGNTLKSSVSYEKDPQEAKGAFTNIRVMKGYREIRKAFEPIALEVTKSTRCQIDLSNGDKICQVAINVREGCQIITPAIRVNAAEKGINYSKQVGIVQLDPSKKISDNVRSYAQTMAEGRDKGIAVHAQENSKQESKKKEKDMDFV